MSDKVQLYVLCFNKQKLQYEILSKDKDLLLIPNREISQDKTIYDTLKELFFEHINTYLPFIDFKLIDINKELGSLNLDIAYYCMMPTSLSLKQGYFIDIHPNEIYHTNLQKILNLL